MWLRLVASLIVPGLVAVGVFHSVAGRAKWWSAPCVSPACGTVYMVSFYDHRRIREHYPDLTVSHRVQAADEAATRHLALVTVGAAASTWAVIALFRRYGPPVHVQVIPPDRPPGSST